MSPEEAVSRVEAMLKRRKFAVWSKASRASLAVDLVVLLADLDPAFAPRPRSRTLSSPPAPVPEPSEGDRMMVVERILWNCRGEDIDEIVLTGVTVHVEQMNDRCWWIGVYKPGGERYWMGNFVADSRGRMRFVEQENNGIVWDRDGSHEEPPAVPEPSEADAADELTREAERLGLYADERLHGAIAYAIDRWLGSSDLSAEAQAATEWHVAHVSTLSDQIMALVRDWSPASVPEPSEGETP